MIDPEKGEIMRQRSRKRDLWDRESFSTIKYVGVKVFSSSYERYEDSRELVSEQPVSI